ncbi:MAG: UDP-glucose 4-epimerase GalE [Saprospiraceae bacterium]
MKPKILVTGGTGYIGSHTIIDLIECGYVPISVDNGWNSDTSVLSKIKKITGQDVKHYPFDLCNFKDTEKIFEENENIVGIIHFAALKAVGESTEIPLMYYKNNLISLINMLELSDKYRIKAFIFSSSCTVYGEGQQSPIDEKAQLIPASSPYGSTKQFSETIINDYTPKTQFQSVLLRYFNPAGAHSSGLIGESPRNIALNLVPVITETAIGKRKSMTVFGEDYTTRDGTCIRDYIHVCDLAHAHTLALKYVLEGRQKVKIDVFNLGIGEGLTVLEIIKAFERVSGQKLNYHIGEKRPGDVQAIYANIQKAKEVLLWQPTKTVDDIMQTAWTWEKNRSANI